MLSQEERDIVAAGAAAKTLIELKEWKQFISSIELLKKGFMQRALQNGDTNYEKGAVFAFDLVLNAPQDTIDAREELLLREKLSGDDDASTGEARPAKENVP